MHGLVRSLEEDSSPLAGDASGATTEKARPGRTDRRQIRSLTASRLVRVLSLGRAAPSERAGTDDTEDVRDQPPSSSRRPPSKLSRPLFCCRGRAGGRPRRDTDGDESSPWGASGPQLACGRRSSRGGLGDDRARLPEGWKKTKRGQVTSVACSGRRANRR